MHNNAFHRLVGFISRASELFKRMEDVSVGTKATMQEIGLFLIPQIRRH